MSEAYFRAITDRLVVRMPQVDDASLLARYFRDNRSHLAPWDPPRPADFLSLAYWERRLTLQQKETVHGRSFMYLWTLKEAANPVVVGICRFSNVVRGGFLACHLGYSAGQRFEGHGYMQEALGVVIEQGFHELRLHRIMANYVPTNERSGRLLRRLGFVVEGYARDYLYVGGAWRDHVLTALTNPDKTLLPSAVKTP